MSTARIREEQPGDEAAIREVVREAFEGAEHSSGTEGAIVDELRRAGALTISLVAVDGADIIGHLAISPVSIPGAEGDWFGFGAVAVRPDRQRQGIGETLINQALTRLRELGAAGCVVLGDPPYYARFGFEHDPALTFPDVPPPYFQLICFGSERPSGAVEYHGAFDAP